ncbi:MULTISPECIES: TnsA endonuclease N-terminal domain-containing protein [unclassified Bradyrhizobium]
MTHAFPSAPTRRGARGRSRRSIVYDFISRKMHSRVPYESTIERDLIIQMEVDPEVTGYWAQPETFKWATEGCKRRYTPDFLVRYRGGTSAYRQVKPLAKWISDWNFGGRRPEIERQCAARGATHEIWTEGMIREQPRLRNATMIVSELGPNLDEFALASLRKALSDGTPETIGDLLSFAKLSTGSIRAVFTPAAMLEISIDLSIPLGPHSKLLRL